jgi:hypothetical protein
MQSFHREFSALSKSFSAVWIEEAVKGDLFRFAFIGGRVVAIQYCGPINVKGDPVPRIGELGNTQRLEPAPGQNVPNSNLSLLTDSIDAAENVHHSYNALVERAMSCIGLKIGSADVAIEEVRTPATNNNYHFIELHSSLEFADHQPFSLGRTPDIAPHVIEYLATL